MSDVAPGERAAAAPWTEHAAAWTPRVVCAAAWLCACFAAASAAAQDPAVVGAPIAANPAGDPDDAVRYRSPEESRQTMRLPPGFRVELAACEPDVVEPVMCAFDADGRMYVAEMRGYVQDVDGTGTDAPSSRVVRLLDRDGDGRFETHTVFLDGLRLPRLLLPLDDAVLIGETWDGIVWRCRDTDGDGRCDERTELWSAGRSDANLEHQDSALTWGIDNWLYTAFGKTRRRLLRDGVVSEAMPGAFAQWGLGVDDVGRQFFSSAGGERPAYDFQLHPIYGKPAFEGTLAPGFEVPYPALALPDVQGGPQRLGDDGRLNHFTGCCGQTIYRGDALPADCRGDLFLCEPVGRLVRRAEVRVVDGLRVLHNRHDGGEFWTSTDANFRPIWSTTGPDGCLYVVDMYRGVIQESNWVREGSYLRPVVQRLGLDRNIGRGRIWRVVHEAHPRSAAQHLGALEPAQLVPFLSHANGALRDTAQKLLVLREARGVAGELAAVVREGSRALGRMHALWTLDGLRALDGELVVEALGDGDPRVRQAALRVAESWLLRGDDDVFDAVRRLAADPDVDVAVQCVLSLRRAAPQRADDAVLDALLRRPGCDVLRKAAATAPASGEEALDAGIELDAAGVALLRDGRDRYRTICVTCHGPDGRGASVGPTLRLGAPLAGSPRVLGDPERLLRILLHGMSGPIDGTSYLGDLMAPMASYDDEWLASVATYLRNSWGNRGSAVRAEDFARVRAAEKGRRLPWTLAELERFAPIAREHTARWTLSSSDPHEACAHAIDGSAATRFSTGRVMAPGMWFRIDLDAVWTIERLVLDTRGSPEDWPRGWVVEASDDGEQWRELATGAGDGPRTDVRFPPAALRHLRVRQTGSSERWWWSIHELEVYGRRAD